MSARAAVVVVIALAALATPLCAQDAAATSGKRAHKSAAAAAPKPKPKAKQKKAESHPAPAPSDAKSKAALSRPEAAPPAAPQPTAAGRALVEDDEDVHKEGGTEIKSVEFGGLDIEGQLKTPQMLYFLNRLRAEFDRPRLPHRSFMPELSRSTQEKDF